MWFVLNFTGIVCFFISNIVLLVNCSFLYKSGGVYVLPLISLLCLWRVTFTDPGCVRTRALNVPKSLEKYAPSKHGGVLQPAHAHWSVTLQQMVLDYDHFCTWCNNGVGLLNLRYFIQFLFWCLVSCLYTFLSIFVHVIQCQWGVRSSCGWLYYNQVLVSPQLALSMIFGLFTGSMLYQQLDNISDGLGSVDRVKGVTVGRKDSFDRFFGDNWFHWFFPVNNRERLYELGRKSVTDTILKLEHVTVNCQYINESL